MSWVEASVERVVAFEAPVARVFGLVADTPRYLKLNTSIERFEKAGEARWRIVLQEKKVAGFGFRSECVLECTDNGSDATASRTVSGNVDIAASWKLEPDGEARTRARYRAKHGMELAYVPGFLKGSIARFIESELDSVTDALVTQLKRELR